MDEMYKNAIYDNKIYEIYKNADNIQDKTVFAKKLKAGYQLENCLPKYMGAYIGSLIFES